MTYQLDLPVIIAAAIAFLIGLILGMMLRGGAKRRALLAEERLRIAGTDRDQLIAERDALRLERDSLDERLRPMAEEVDRLKRAEVRRAVPVSEVPVASHATATASAAASSGDLNDVRRLKGVGDRFAAALANVGVTRIDQIAAWSGSDIDKLDTQLGSFAGRIRTDRLVEQARLLNDGRTTEYEARFGAL